MPDPSRSSDTLSRIGLGCSRVGSFNNPAPMSEIRATLRGAIDLGVTVFDTSNIYGQGDSEREIGRAVDGRRDEAFIVTKLGKTFSLKMRAMSVAKPLVKAILSKRGGGQIVTAQRAQQMSTDFSPANFAATLDASLRRLGTDHVDGLLLHSPPAEVVLDPEVMEALAALKTAGKVRHFGVSCDDLACLEAAIAAPGVELIQIPIDVLDALPSPSRNRLKQLEIQVFAREVLASRPTLPPAQAIAEACARDDVACVIVGTSRLAHLREARQACA